MNTANIKAFLLKAEPIIFLLIVCANLYPLFAGKHLAFMDTPAHLYNAGLVKQMAFSHNLFLEKYLAFNHVFVPNWLCHLIMSPLLLIFSANVTEKILLVCFFVGLPFATRYCVSVINKNQKYLALLILPFTYNFLSMIGFYNFCLGLVFMLITIGFFYKYFIHDIKWYHYIILLALLLTTYTCHIVVLGITLVCLFLIYLWHLISVYNFSIRIWFSLKTIKLIAVVLPIVILMGIYYAKIQAAGTNNNFLSKQELFNYFKDGRMFTIFNGNEEQNHSNFLALFYLATIFIAFYLFVANFSKSFYKNVNFYFFISLLLLLVLYLKLPDSDGLAGFISIRISILVFILSILFIATCYLKNNYLLSLCAVIVFIHFKRLPYYNDVVKQGSSIAESIVEQSKLIEANSFVMPFKYDDNWFSGHYSNYTGLNKSVICLENYECNTGYFPLTWKDKDQIWNLQQSLSSFQNLTVIKQQLNQSPVYYWILGDLNSKTDSVSSKFKQALTGNCILINTTPVSALYKLK
jgi:hypothetical protein